MFDTTKEDLKDILRKAHEGKLQLPDFQRSYVWQENDVRSLLASIAKGFPVGALLTLETGGSVSFQPRLLEGVTIQSAHPDELLLDGQQRVTSLYQAFHCSSAMRTKTHKNTEVDRYFYLDMQIAVQSGADIEDAIVGVPGDRVIRRNFGREVVLDLSTPENEFERDYFPLNQVFDPTEWHYGWREFWKDRKVDRFELDKKFFKGILENIQRYKMPIIRLDKNNSREAICLVFEKVNVGGKKLDAFELLTAIYAASSFDLREDWQGSKEDSGCHRVGRKSRMYDKSNPRRVLSQVESTDFLQACALIHTRERRQRKAESGAKESELPQISCKKEALLSLPLTAYRAHADSVEAGFVEAAGFLNELKIVLSKDVPYPPQITALAATLSVLGSAGHSAAARDQLAQWFWSVSLGEQYGSSTESKLARDFPELINWIQNGGPKPRSLEEAIFQQDRLSSLRSRVSAAYKALHALLMHHGCRDFINGKSFELMTFYNEKVDVHHVFPRDWCRKAGIEKKVYDSIVNKTPLSKKSNILIRCDAPSVYLKRIEEKHGLSSDRLDGILRTHLIDPDCLRRDDFTGFFASRLRSLSGLVEEALGKAVVRSHGSDEVETESEDESVDSSSEENEDMVST